MASLISWRRLSWYAEWPIKSPKFLFSYNSSSFPSLTCMEITSTLWNLRFPQQRYWILKPPRMWNCIMKWVLLTYLTNTGPSTSPRISCLLDCWTLTIKALLFLWSTGNYSPTDTAPHPTRSETSVSPLYEILGSQGVSITVSHMEYGAIPTSIWKREAACPLDI